MYLELHMLSRPGQSMKSIVLDFRLISVMTKKKKINSKFFMSISSILLNQ